MTYPRRQGARIRRPGYWLVMSMVMLSMAYLCPPVIAQTPSSKADNTIDCGVWEQTTLREPDKILPRDGRLETQLTVAMRDHCVPVWRPDTGAWIMLPMRLRTYGYTRPNRQQQVWSFPGPTLVLAKSSTPDQRDGTRLQVNLVNELPSNEPTLTGCGYYAAGEAKWDRYPNCYYKYNTTNLHFHGLHISPQSSQDNVRVKVETNRTFSYDVDPLMWEQAEGTHWYHPINHGSTAIQVTNGMAGAVLIQGPFDDWMQAQYSGQLTEKLMVVQQVQPSLPLINPDVPVNPAPLVNGQGDPILTMQPGEVQRWRLVMATVSAKAQVAITFPHAFTVRQLAMDGVRFAPENYAVQPLLTEHQITLHSGNRADFLVQAPSVDAIADYPTPRFKITQRLNQQSVALFTVTVSGPPKPMTSPADLQWPPMPEFLRDIPEPHDQREIVYEQQEGESGSQEAPPRFVINEVQYVPLCASRTFTVKLGASVKWRIRNASNGAFQPHPFHMHVHPFQVVQKGSITYDPPIWQDTVALPGNTTDELVLYQRFRNFTGGFVHYSHTLGHQDRGMMANIQALCENGLFGKPGAGLEPECREGNYTDAWHLCPPADIIARLQREGGNEWLSLCVPAGGQAGR